MFKFHIVNFALQYDSIILANEELLVKEANDYLVNLHNVSEIEDLPQGVLPYEEREFVVEGCTVALTVEDIKESFPSFERLFKEKWITSMENDFNSTIQTLTDKVHNFLSEFFEVRSGRETQIFFDIGMEVRLDNGTSLLIDPTKLLPIMVEKSRER